MTLASDNKDDNFFAGGGGDGTHEDSSDDEGPEPGGLNSLEKCMSNMSVVEDDDRNGVYGGQEGYGNGMSLGNTNINLYLNHGSSDDRMDGEPLAPSILRSDSSTNEYQPTKLARTGSITKGTKREVTEKVKESRQNESNRRSSLNNKNLQQHDRTSTFDSVFLPGSSPFGSRDGVNIFGSSKTITSGSGEFGDIESLGKNININIGNGNDANARGKKRTARERSYLGSNDNDDNDDDDDDDSDFPLGPPGSNPMFNKGQPPMLRKEQSSFLAFLDNNPSMLENLSPDELGSIYNLEEENNGVDSGGEDNFLASLKGVLDPAVLAQFQLYTNTQNDGNENENDDDDSNDNNNNLSRSTTTATQIMGEDIQGSPFENSNVPPAPPSLRGVRLHASQANSQVSSEHMSNFLKNTSEVESPHLQQQRLELVKRISSYNDQVVEKIRTSYLVDGSTSSNQGEKSQDQVGQSGQASEKTKGLSKLLTSLLGNPSFTANNSLGNPNLTSTTDNDELNDSNGSKSKSKGPAKIGKDGKKQYKCKFCGQVKANHICKALQKVTRAHGDSETDPNITKGLRPLLLPPHSKLVSVGIYEPVAHAPTTINLARFFPEFAPEVVEAQEEEHLRQQQLQQLQQLQLLQQLGAIGNALSGLGNINNLSGSSLPTQTQSYNQMNTNTSDESMNAPVTLSSMRNMPSFLNTSITDAELVKDNDLDDEDDPEALQQQMAKLQQKLERLKNKKKEGF